MTPWNKLKLVDVADVMGGGTPSTNEPKYWGGNTPWLTPKDLSGYENRYISKGERHITDDGLKNSSAKLMPKGSVLMTSRAPIGYVAIAQNNVCTNQGFKSLVLKKGNCPEFFYYLLKVNKEYIASMGSGSTFAEISGSQVKDMEFSLPPLDEQERIAGVLGAFDDKIELLREQNKTLEDMAKAIFKSWFVDFDIVKAKSSLSTCGRGIEGEGLNKNKPSHRSYPLYIKEFARTMRKEPTKEENNLWQAIRNNQLECKFRRQHPIDNQYIADFVCLEKRLIIELDGSQHAESISDKERTVYLESQDFRVIRFWNNEILNNLEGCLSVIIDELKEDDVNKPLTRAKLDLSLKGRGFKSKEEIISKYKITEEIYNLFPDSFSESPLGPIPTEWSVKPLSGIANYLNGLALQKFPPENDKESLPVLKIAELRNGISNSTNKASRNIDSKYIINDGDVIFSWSGSLLVKIWAEGKAALNQHLFKVSSETFPKWFYYLWTLEHLMFFQEIAAGKATTMGHIQRQHLDDAKVFIPSKKLVDEGSKVIQPLLDSFVENSKQIQTLTKLRDSLLPKLISGTIRV